MIRTVRSETLAIALVALLPIVAGCQTAPKATGPIRAIWVTRFDYKTPQDVKHIMDNCASAGFNTVLWQVRGNGTVAYESKIEPWAEQFNFRSPGFDPLALAIREAHARGLQLHAWANVMPAWRGPGEPPIRNQLYHAHPDWFWYDAQGRRQPIHHRVEDRQRDWYVSLNPCLPEVRAYLVDVFRELVSKYDLDGLHMDYIRFPNEPVVAGEVIPDYPRDRRTLDLFRRASGHTPESNPAHWDRWRTDQVTNLVADLHAMMRRARPGAVLSAAASARRADALAHHQDADEWLRRGIIDVVYLMNYTPNAEEFSQRIAPWLAAAPKTRLVPGLSFRDDGDAAAGATVARRQIEIARTATGNFCVFAYSSLFDSANTEFDRQDRPEMLRRAARRQVLIPFLQALARGPRMA